MPQQKPQEIHTSQQKLRSIPEIFLIALSMERTTYPTNWETVELLNKEQILKKVSNLFVEYTSAEQEEMMAALVEYERQIYLVNSINSNGHIIAYHRACNGGQVVRNPETGIKFCGECGAKVFP